MAMKKDSLRGWKSVFSFNVIQTLKSRSYRISLLIMLALTLLSMPLLNLFLLKDSAEGPEQSVVKRVYLYNMTMYRDFDVTEQLSEGYRHIVLEETAEDMEMLKKRICEEETDSVILILTEDEQNVYLQFLRAPEGDVTAAELQTLGKSVEKAYLEKKMEVLSVPEEQMKRLKKEVIASAQVVDTEHTLVLEDSSISDSEYWFVYGILFAVLMISVMASTSVATSIVKEKSSRVIEYLLTSVRPLAIIVGKVLASLTTEMLKIVLLLAAGLISTKIGAALSGTGSNALAQYLSPEILNNLKFFPLLLGLLTAGAGLVFYETLAGLCGATASRMEETNDSLMLFTVTALVGAYIGMGAAGSLMGIGDNAFVTFALIFPLSSSFLLPGALLVGKADAAIALVAVAVLLLSIVLMFLFVARVYETLILHTGTRIKMKEVLAIAKQEKGRGKA